MTTVEQIDYMIQSLRVAKDEIEYAQEYELLLDVKKYDDSIRTPNGTIIRESVKDGRKNGIYFCKQSEFESVL